MSNQPPNTRLQLLDKVTANTTGEWFEWTGTGVGTQNVYGTPDTCSIQIQGSTDGGVTAVDIGSAIAAAAISTFEHGNILVRAVISSVGASTSMSVDLVPPERP